MGSGKTAVGKRLAALLDKQFLDSDAEIERRCGVDIRYIFEKEGEARFRERERDVIAALARSTASSSRRAAARCSIPTTASGSRRTGTVVYLEATVDAQLKRTQPSRNRPLLKGGDPRAILERLMSIRRPLYESIADIRIDTTGRQVGAVASDVRAALDGKRH